MEHQDNCGVCGKPLIYTQTPLNFSCYYCKEVHQSNIYCGDGHFVCDACHQLKGVEVLRQVLSKSSSTSPVELMEKVMSHPSVPMHGPEHHSIVPAVLVAAAKNAGYTVPDNAIETAITRGMKIPGGWCGFYGACGAAIGAGIAVSVLTGATPLTGKERSLALEATSLAMSDISDDQPRCCKRSSRKAIKFAIEYLKAKLNIQLTDDSLDPCSYSPRNKECPKTDCIYYKK
ncbi:MAG: DUF5714 domain-containing protein [Chloroflexi bacterium]|nr:DUF5714 domain-containing protein [Chloroflexota bacterium]